MPAPHETEQVRERTGAEAQPGQGRAGKVGGCRT